MHLLGGGFSGGKSTYGTTELIVMNLMVKLKGNIVDYLVKVHHDLMRH